LKPLQQVLLTVAPELSKDFATIVARQDRRRRDEKAASREAEIVRAIGAHITAVEHGYLPIGVVLDALNTTRPAEHQLTAKWLAGKVRGMGFTVERVGHHKASALHWDPDLLARLLEHYGADGSDKTAAEYSAQIPDPTPARDVPHVPHVPPASGEECGTLAAAAADQPNVPHKVPQTDGPRSSGEGANATHAAHAARSPDPTPPPALLTNGRPCAACGGSSWWRRPGGGQLLCARCHPPATAPRLPGAQTAGTGARA
jgi:hypothetical protein